MRHIKLFLKGFGTAFLALTYLVLALGVLVLIVLAGLVVGDHFGGETGSAIGMAIAFIVALSVVFGITVALNGGWD